MINIADISVVTWVFIDAVTLIASTTIINLSILYIAAEVLKYMSKVRYQLKHEQI
jgi:hypothetical protein